MIFSKHIHTSFSVGDGQDLLRPLNGDELSSTNGKRQQIPIFSANYGKDSSEEDEESGPKKVLGLSLRHILRGA